MAVMVARCMATMVGYMTLQFRISAKFSLLPSSKDVGAPTPGVLRPMFLGLFEEEFRGLLPA